MINLHWSWFVFVPVVCFLLWLVVRDTGPKGDYGIDIEKPFWAIILIAFILVWGGFFWW